MSEASPDGAADTVRREEYEQLFEELEAMQRSSSELECELRRTLGEREAELRALRRQLNDEAVQREASRSRITELMATEQLLREELAEIREVFGVPHNGAPTGSRAGSLDQAASYAGGGGGGPDSAAARSLIDTGSGSPGGPSGFNSPSGTCTIADLREENVQQRQEIENFERLQREGDFSLRRAEQRLAEAEERALLLEAELEEERETVLELRKQRDAARKDAEEAAHRAATVNGTSSAERPAAAATPPPAPPQAAVAAAAVPPGCVAVNAAELRCVVAKLRQLAAVVQQQGQKQPQLRAEPVLDRYFDEF